MNKKLQEVVQGVTAIETTAVRLAAEIESNGGKKKTTALTKSLVKQIEALKANVYHLEKGSAIVDVIRAAAEYRSNLPK